MDEVILIKLLQIHFEHQRKLSEFAGKINLSYFEIDLLGLVLDAAGVPADNTVEQIGKYGYNDWIEQPDTFSRVWYYEDFQRQVAHGSYEECRAYLEGVIVTTTFQHLLKGGRVETALTD
jgi:hypothetical protein